MSKSKFTGDLAEKLEPIIVGVLPRLLNLPPDEREMLNRRAKIESNLQLILKHYQIGGDDHAKNMEQLAAALLREFVPGFQVANPNQSVGRKKAWTQFRVAALVYEMRRQIRAKKCAVSDAARALSKRKPWSEILASTSADDDPAEALRTRYQRALKSTRQQNNWAESLHKKELSGQRPVGTYQRILDRLSDFSGGYIHYD